MIKTGKQKFISLCSLLFFVAAVILSAGMVSGQEEVSGSKPLTISKNLEDKLNDLSDEEKHVLEELFVLTQSIDELEKEKNVIADDMEDLQREISALRKLISAEEKKFALKQEALKQVLRSYQRMGPSSYLERLLDSSSLSDFLRRLSTLRDLTRNTGELLDLLQESRDQLTAQKENLDTQVISLQETKERLTELIHKNNELIQELEDYLVSLAEEREFYESQLYDIQQAWNELTLFFPEVTKSFSRIIKEADLPEDALRIKFTTSGIKAAVSDDTINSIIADYGLTDLVFQFMPGEVELAVPEKELILAGTFILEEKMLKFKAYEGTFYGMILTSGNLEALFAEEELLLDLTNLLGDNDVRSVEVLSDQLELVITPNL